MYLAVLLGIWFTVWALHLYGVNGPFRAPLMLWVRSAATADSYPTIHHVSAGSPAAVAGLRPGDALLQVGSTNVRGASDRSVHVLAYRARDSQLRLPLVLLRDGTERFEPVLVSRPRAAAWTRPLVSLVFAVCGALLVFRSPSRSTRAIFASCIVWGASICPPFASTAPALFLASNLVGNAFQILVFVFSLRAVILCPEEVAPRRRIAIEWPWLIVPWMVLLFVMLEYDWGPAPALLSASYLSLCLASFGVLARNYLRSSPVDRRRIKWVVLGFYFGFAPAFAMQIWMGIAPVSALAFTMRDLAWLPAVLCPLSLLVAAARYNLFDIDRLFSATASYNVLLVSLGAAALVAVPRLASAASEAIGIDAGNSQVALSLLLAVAVIPAQHRLRPLIDRLLFKERHALDAGIARLLSNLSDCAGASDLTQRIGAGLIDLLRPEVCVVYARVNGRYSPVFVQGRAVPPAFADASPLIATLSGRHRPIALSSAGRTADAVALSPADRAALATLGAEVVVPAHDGRGLAAFLCLGAKRSGDVYTGTDLALLMALAKEVESKLRAFDHDATVREARAMQDSLRRYVPGAIAEQLANGAELVDGEREVTVLFVDLRGYTHFAQNRRAEEIFSAVNLYTETVSQIVRSEGGSVVEFNGDGMMTVFGAPRELADKERAALRAGRRIVAAVEALTVPEAGGGATRLSVGVGIATGAAFVGNIQAVDRFIWSAIGNTTNLAARLQALTRELDAVLVCDRPTWSRAGELATDLEIRREVTIRGQSKCQDIFVLAQAGQIQNQASA